MAALLVKLHEAVNDYKNSSEDKGLATGIGGELLVLSKVPLCSACDTKKIAYIGF